MAKKKRRSLTALMEEDLAQEQEDTLEATEAKAQEAKPQESEPAKATKVAVRSQEEQDKEADAQQPPAKEAPPAPSASEPPAQEAVESAPEDAEEAPKPAPKKRFSRRKRKESTSPPSEYIPISVTIPPEMFDEIQAISSARRKRREPYSVSKIIRDALHEWLPKQ